MLPSSLNDLYKRVTQSKILRHSSALMFGNFTSTGFLFLLSIFLARQLGADNYGQIVLAMTIVKGIARFIDLRSDEVIIKFMGEALATGQKHGAMAYFYIGVLAD